VYSGLLGRSHNDVAYFIYLQTLKNTIEERIQKRIVAILHSFSISLFSVFLFEAKHLFLGLDNV